MTHRCVIVGKGLIKLFPIGCIGLTVQVFISASRFQRWLQQHLFPIFKWNGSAERIHTQNTLKAAQCQFSFQCIIQRIYLLPCLNRTLQRRISWGNGGQVVGEFFIITQPFL